MFNKKHAEQSFENYKKWANKYIVKGKYELALESLSIACQIAHNYFIKLSDNEIEDNLSNVAKALVQSKLNMNTSKKYVLYDSVALDNMSLTQQYMRALISWDVEFLYILNDDSRIKNAQDIIQEVKYYNGAEIFVVSSDLSKTDKIDVIVKKIIEYAPYRAFLHMDIDDVVGVVAWNNINSTTRYLINHADHAFWIGTSCSDYIISFRAVGLNASKVFRNFDENRLLVQPFYPIIPDIPFEGWPEGIDSKSVKLFSGGRFLKIYGASGQFMKMMKQILMENPEAILLFAGWGNQKPLKRFIKKYHLEKRWIVIKYRRDLVQVLNNVDVYVGTYPYAGGLMSQYAAYCGKPMLEFKSYDELTAESFLPKITESSTVTYDDLNDYYCEAKKIISDKDYRESVGNNLSKTLIKPNEFNMDLKSNIDNPNNKFINSIGNLDLQSMCEGAIETENKFLHAYPRLMINRILLQKSFVKFFIYCLMYIRYNGIKTILVRTSVIVKRVKEYIALNKER